MKNQWLTKFSSALLIVMLAVAVLPVTAAYAADTGLNVPTACNSGGGQWFGTGNAAASDNTYTVSNANTEVLTCTFNIAAIPAGATVNGIEVLIEGSTGGRQAAVDLSWDGGTTYTGGDPTTAFTAVDTTPTFGGAAVNWGRTWAPGELATGLFRVRLTSNNGAGNLSVDRIQVRVTYTPDAIAPTLTSFTRQTPATSPTNVDTLIFLATFSEPVQNVNVADFAVVGTTATIAVAQVTTSTYTITLTGGNLAALNGTVGVNLAVGQNITDLSANPLPTTEPVTDETYVVDNTAPTLVSFTLQAPVSSPTNSDTLTFRVIFNEPMLNVSNGDFDVTGSTANPTTTVAIDAFTYDVTISGGDLATFNGLVTLDLDTNPAGGIHNITDAAGNALPNTQPATDQAYLVDNTGPTVTINQAAGQADPTNNSPINFTVVFSEAPTGFATGDVTFPAPNTAGGTLVGTVTGGPTTFNVAVTGMTTAGNVVPSILAGVATDAAGNNNVAATSTDRTVAFVPKVNTTTTVSCLPGPVSVFSGTTCTVSVTRAGGTNVPSGTVTLGSTGAGAFSPAATCTLAGAGATTSCSVTYTPSAVGSGTHAISANYGGDVNFNASNGNQNLTVNKINATIVVTPYNVTYDGTPHTATGTATGVLGVNLSGLNLGGTTHTNAGVYNGDVWTFTDVTGNYNNANGTVNDLIGIASSTVTVTCPASVTYTGAAQTPCTAQVTGAGMAALDVTASLIYSNNTNAGAATVSVTWPGDANHTGNTGLGGFAIGQASSTVTVICPASVTYTGLALTPCTAQATGAGMSSVDVTASLIYSNNINVGAASADASWGGDANHTGNNGLGGFAIGQASQTITVTTSAPITASNGSTFNVAATSDSGLIVSITSSGSCTFVDNGDGTASITMISGSGTCSVFYDQAGNVNYTAASQVQEDVTATEGPTFTSANNASFDLGLAGSFTITATGNPSAMTINQAGTLPSGVTFVDNSDGTATLSGIPALGTNGTYSLVFTANNGVAPNATQNFTLTVKNGPVIGANGINSTPDTGDGSVTENESIIDTLGLTKLTVEFSQDVYDDPTDALDFGHDVTNPANYILVRSTTNSFATIDCAGGVVSPDINISVDSVSYSNGGGSGPYVATLSINGGLPLNVVGFYRLYVCGTTSIVDANNRSLELAGNGTTPGTDYLRNFRIATAVVTTDGGGRGASSTSTKSVVTSGFLIPVTGFAPNQITTLPVQPADKMYTSMGQMTIEIPSLGVKFPIVGASITNKTWDLTWLKNSVAYLEGSAYPTTAGNTVLTAHVQDANKNLGPFSDIKGMQLGQNIYIHVNGQVYVYQVQENSKIASNNIATMFKHEEDSWITLVTCEDYNAKTGVYSNRRMVRAVLISVIFEK